MLECNRYVICWNIIFKGRDFKKSYNNIILERNELVVSICKDKIVIY